MSLGPKPAEPELIEAVAAGIAHEVRNPLNALQINVRILEEELQGLVTDRDARVYAVLSKISSELKNLDNFVTEFLRFAKPPRIKLESLPVRSLLSDLATFIAPECARKQVTLELSLERGPAIVQADSFQLKHAVLNLVLNALQASRPGGTIQIVTDGPDDTLVIDVVDGGDGIPAEHLARVFDVFFTMREGGTGLGLPIAKRIVEEHGGRLTLTSLPAVGTQARITLPARGPS